MPDEDDDLPVLTNVLRTRTNVLPPPILSALDDIHPDFDIHAIEVAPMTSQIVIGNEPQYDEDASLPGGPPTIGRWEDVASNVPDARLEPSRDAFRLSQDSEDHHLPAAIDEPEIMASPPPPPAPPARGEGTPELSPEFAEDVREAVLRDLMGRIQIDFDARVAQAVHAELETALGGLQTRLRENLTAALRDVVALAVDEELERMRWARARSNAAQ
jgi:hypothetical protein